MRDVIAKVVMIMLVYIAVAGLFSPLPAPPELAYTVGWRRMASLVFAGLFLLLAYKPRRYPGVWELCLFHRAALALYAAYLTAGGQNERPAIAINAIILALLLIAYILTGAYAWRAVRTEPEAKAHGAST